jgi:hypothetical protein
LIAKRFDRIPCNHTGLLKQHECLRSLLGSDNERKYCVGAQDVRFRNHVRKFSCTPLLFIRECTPILEPPSQAKKKHHREELLSDVLSKREQKAVKAILDSGGETDKKKDAATKRKRKGPRMPNPLSVKKKTARGASESVGEESTSPKRRRPNKASAEDSKCFEFQKSGACRYGSECKFSHVTADAETKAIKVAGGEAANKEVTGSGEVSGIDGEEDAKQLSEAARSARKKKRRKRGAKKKKNIKPAEPS